MMRIGRAGYGCATAHAHHAHSSATAIARPAFDNAIIVAIPPSLARNMA
jgi:hypothetical protein